MLLKTSNVEVAEGTYLYQYIIVELPIASENPEDLIGGQEMFLDFRDIFR